MGKQWKQWLTLFFGLQNNCRWWLQPWSWKTLTPWKESYHQPKWYVKSRDITLPTKVHLIKAMVFPVVIYGCESWTVKNQVWNSILPPRGSLLLYRARKNWCFWTVVLEKTLESPLNCKEIQPVDPKGNQSWILIGKTDAATPRLWPSDVKKWLIWKDIDAGKDWRWEEKGMTEDEMVGWHHWLRGHEFE